MGGPGSGRKKGGGKGKKVSTVSDRELMRRSKAAGRPVSTTKPSANELRKRAMWKKMGAKNFG